MYLEFSRVTERVRRALRMAAGTAVLAAPISVLWLIFRYGVNVPIEDQIDIGAFLVRNHGRLFPAVGDLFAQHNESRKVIPRLIIFYLARLTQWNVKAEMAIEVAIACGSIAAIWILARRSLGDLALPATALCALLALSPVQWANWLFGIQIVTVLPMLMLTIALAVTGSTLTLPSRIGLAALCCAMATYSYANGMLLWVLVCIALLAKREDRRAVGLWCALTIVMIGAYFFHYTRPAVSPSLVSPIDHPFAAARFVLAFLGHPLTWTGAVLPCAIIGAIGAIVFVFAAIRAGSAGVPWMLIGMYSIISAAAAAVGRIGFGESAAVEPRYPTFAVGFWVATVMLVAMTLPRVRLVAAVALIALHVAASIAVFPNIRAVYRDRLVAKTAMQFATVLSDDSLFRRLIYRDTQKAIAIVSALARIGYINPPPVDSPIVRSSGATPGALEGVMQAGPHQWVMYGWALLPDGRPADAVLITRGDSIFAISERTIGRPDRPGPGWDLPVTQRFAVNGAVYNAYAYDTSTGRAYHLGGSLRIGSR